MVIWIDMGYIVRKINNGWSEHLLVITSVEVVVGLKKNNFPLP